MSGQEVVGQVVWAGGLAHDGNVVLEVWVRLRK